MGITGPRKVRWSLIDTAGELQHIKLHCCHAPLATWRLLSTSVFCKACPKNSIVLNPKSWTVQPDPDELNKNAIDININPNNNLPATECVCTDSLNNPAVHFSENLTVTTHQITTCTNPKRNCCIGTASWDTKIHKTSNDCCNQTCWQQLTQ